ncbi:MAG: deoxyribose-phosphate aldolase [bacterium]|nr:deoxyribose-phosphate aldolase [bacterium]
MSERDNNRDFRNRIRNDIDLASYIDAAVLKTETSASDIEKLCAEAIEYHYKAIFINPTYTAMCAQLLRGSGVRLGSVAGFPLGATTTEVKIFEGQESENHGAEEIDMVANVGAIKSGNWAVYEKDIAGVRNALSRQTTLKVILECTLLSREEKITAATIAADCGVDFVKTSTGMFGQATVEDVALLFETVGNRIAVKASGGIRNLPQALAMIEAGASRIGTSSGVAIIAELRNRS